MEPDTSTRTSFGNRYLTGVEVRRAFVAFFEGKDHREVPSSSLCRTTIPTVL
jgi:alanyl-tRNA synthetase